MLNDDKTEFLLLGTKQQLAVGLWLKRRIAAVTGTCIFGDSATFINKDRRIYLEIFSLCLGIFDSKVKPRVGKFGCI